MMCPNEQTCFSGQFIVVSIHRMVDSSQGWIVSSQGQFIARSIHSRFNLSQGRFIAELCQLKTLLKRVNFCLDIQNWVLFVVKTFSSPLGATEKLVLLKST
jgi:hypothetical protein